MAYRREQYATLAGRLREPPRTLTYVTGPRQSGKTTLINQVLEDQHVPSLYVAVDEPDPAAVPRPADLLLSPRLTPHPRSGPPDVRWLAALWEQARMEASGSEHGFILALDEIQKVPAWSDAVKGLWDADRRDRRHLHVILAGSAPMLMHQGTTESLAGRFETIRLPHWSFAEMAKAFNFDLERYIYFGGYPKVAEFVGADERWRSYILDAVIEPHIERDVLAMQRVDKQALLRNLFELGTAYSGQILSYNKMLGQLQDAGNTTTLARYERLLRQAGLLAGLAKYCGAASRRRASSPKWNTLNTALVTASSDYTFEEALADRSYWGRLVESAVGAHLCNTAGRGVHVCYWREAGKEVDFVLRRGQRVLGIEVKSGTRPGPLTGLAAFKQKFPRAQTLLVGANGVPVQEFLAHSAAHWLTEHTDGLR